MPWIGSKQINSQGVPKSEGDFSHRAGNKIGLANCVSEHPHFANLWFMGFLMSCAPADFVPLIYHMFKRSLLHKEFPVAKIPVARFSQIASLRSTQLLWMQNVHKYLTCMRKKILCMCSVSGKIWNIDHWFSVHISVSDPQTLSPFS